MYRCVYMNLIQNLERFSCSVSFDIDDKEQEKTEEMFTLIDNLRISVLKSLMLKLDSGKFIFDFLNSLPLMRLYSEKLDYSISIFKNAITASTPSPSKESEQEEELGKTINKIIPNIERSLTAIISAITAKEEKPLEISKLSIRLYFKVEEDLLSKIISETVKVSLDTDYNLGVSDIGITASNEDSEQNYTVEISKDSIAFLLECECEESFNIKEKFNFVLNDAERFLKERKLYVKS